MKTALAFLLAITGCAFGQGYPYSYPAADGCNTVTVRSPTYSEVTTMSCNIGYSPLFLGIPDPRDNKIGPIGWQRTIWPTIVRECAAPSGPRQTCTQWEGDCCMAMTVYQEAPNEMDKPWEPLHPLMEIQPRLYNPHGWAGTYQGFLFSVKGSTVLECGGFPVSPSRWHVEGCTIGEGHTLDEVMQVVMDESARKDRSIEKWASEYEAVRKRFLDYLAAERKILQKQLVQRK